MRRFFNILLGALAMIAVALLSAFITMRLAIHGREVEIPNVAGLTVAEAKGVAANLGLNVNVESRFYSTVTPAGRVLSQYPAPGTKVRREWVMRVAESTGPQRVSVPNVIGQTEREATVTIRRLSLDLGTVAYVPTAVPPGIVLSQTPTPAAEGVDGPRISLLVSEPLPVAKVHTASVNASEQQPDSSEQPPVSAASTETQAGPDAAHNVTNAPATAQEDAATAPAAYVMPNLIGLTLSAAAARAAAMGLHISSMDSVAPVVRQVAPVAEPTAPGLTSQPSAVKPMAPITPIRLSNTVIAQSPAAGRRVTKADAIHITVTR